MIEVVGLIEGEGEGEGEQLGVNNEHTENTSDRCAGSVYCNTLEINSDALS